MTENRTQLDSAIARLEALAEDHLVLGKAMMEAAGGNLYGLDLLAVGALNRSRAHIRGFINLVGDRNILCAGALLRLQLDTALRFHAAWLVDDPHRFAIDVLGGKAVRDLRDADGRRMTDRYLTERLSAEYEWVPRVYDRSSAYIHFSSVHMHAAISSDPHGDKPGSFQMHIADPDRTFPEELLVEGVDAFAAATEILLRYVHGWVYTKNNPGAVAAARKERDSRREP